MMAENKNKEYTIVIPSDTHYLSKVDTLCTKIVKNAGLNESDGDDVAIAVTELVNNAIKHGNKYDKNKKVLIKFIVESNKIIAIITDSGIGFNPKEVRNPLDPENIMKESGRGLFLIKELMDTLDYKFTNTGTEVITTKKINSDSK